MSTNGSFQNGPIHVALEKLEEARAIKVAEVAEIDKAIEQLRQLVQVVAPGTLPKAHQFTGMGLTDSALAFLKEAGEKGRTTREIADALMDRGLTTRSKNFIATVYATLTNGSKGSDARFKREGDRWYLQEATQPSIATPVESQLH